MSKDYKIRNATFADETEILEMARNVTDVCSRAYLGDETVDRYINSGSCDSDMKKNISNMILLTIKNKIIGLMIWHSNQMFGFMIDIPYHGTGAAQYFCNKIIPEKFNEFDELVLECFDNNARGINFYKKMGWIEYDRIKDAEINGSRILFKISK